MKQILFSLLFVFSILSAAHAQDEPFTKETLREYYPILTAITDADMPAQDCLFGFYQKFRRSEITSDQEVEQILRYRDSLATILTPHVRKWIAENYDEEYENYFNIRGELNQIMIEPMLHTDTLYALFSMTNDYVLETRATADYWLYIRYCDARQYTGFAQQHGLNLDFLHSYYEIIDIYLEMKQSFPKSTWLPKMRKDFESALVFGLDLHVLALSEQSYVLSTKSGKDTDVGKVMLEELYGYAGAYTRYAPLISRLLEDISIMEQDGGQEVKSLFIISIGKSPVKGEAEKARIKYLEEQKVIPHIIAITASKTTMYHNVYRFYSNEAVATETLKNVKKAIPAAVMVKTGPNFRFE
ncbi:MAG TPA: hypothetical protein P5228_10370 [Bacteroidales bacterium]|nr:hypothetical protein [Bacteroidales bacterium]HRZ50207.1 hypothetical protein [Bacteroidales bacterium]